MARKKKYSRLAWMRAIRGNPKARTENGRMSSDGHIPLIAARLACTTSAVYYNMKDGSGLAEEICAAIEEERDNMLKLRQAKQPRILAKAIDNLELLVDACDWRASRFAIERLGKDDYSLRHELTGKDGGGLFSPADLELLKELGMEPSQAVQEFIQALQAAKIRAEAESDG